MTSPKEHSSNFWFGFAFGSLAVVAGSFFLGAKDGRDFLKRLLDFTEDLEKNLENVQEEMHEVKKKAEQVTKETLTQEVKHEMAEVVKPLNDVLQKIHSLSPTKPLPDRFTTHKN